MKVPYLRVSSSLLILIVISLAFSSCKKIKEEQIDGEWVRSKMWDLNPEFKEYWTFMNNVVTVEKEEFSIMPGDTVPTLHREVYDIAKYSVSRTINNTYVHIKDFTMDEFYTFNKEWQVIDIDREIFSLATSAGTGLIFLEFYDE